MKSTEALPFLEWLPEIRQNLWADILCGLTLALVLVPQAMAYAQIVGMPPVYGLYSALVPGFLGALLGYSRHLSTGPTAISAMLTFSLMSAEFGTKIPPEQYVPLTLLLAFMCGVIMLLAGLLRLGDVANFLSEPVLRGFTSAAALIIVASQLDDLLGIKTDRGVNFFKKMLLVAETLPQCSWPTIALSAVTMALMWVVKKFFKRVPDALVASGLLTVVVYGFAQSGHELSVRIVGVIPQGMPSFEIPHGLMDFSLFKRIVPQALMVSFIIFIEISSVTRAIAEKSRARVLLNQELVGKGLACMGGSFFCGFPVGGSFSRRALCYASGGKTGMSHIIASFGVLFTLLWLTPLLYYLPKAALSAMIILAVVKLLDFPSMMRAWRAQRSDGICAFATLFLTLYLSPAMTDGILYGAGLAIILFLRRSMAPRACLVEPHSDGRFRDALHHNIHIDSVLPILRFDGRLYFANVSYFEKKILQVAREYPQCRYILLLGEGINDIDASGENMLRQLAKSLREGGVGLAFVGFKLQVREVLDRTGLSKTLGEEYFFSTCEKARENLSLKSSTSPN